VKNKKLIKIGVAVLLVVAIVVGAAFFVHKKKADRFEAVILEVGTSTVKQTLSTQGVVESTNRGEYEIFDGVVVKEVFVKLGDKVEDGQLLATFEPASLNGILSEKQSAYDMAKINYHNSINSANEAAAKLPSINAEIAELEKEVSKLAATAGKDSSADKKKVPDWVNGIDYETLSKLLGNNYSVEELREYFTKLALRGADRKTASDIIDSFKIGSSFDFASMFGASSAEAELMSAEFSLMSLKAQKTLFETQSQNVLKSTYKSLMDTAKSDLDRAKSSVEKLKKGWYSEGSGVVSELNITAGQTFAAVKTSGGIDMSSLLGLMSGGTATPDIGSLMSAFSGSSKNIGLAVEYYDSFVASFTLGKFDVLDVKVGQKATINSLGHVLDGEVIYISPVASSSSSIDISSMLGGAASASSNTIPAKVKINNPDESVIIGIDVDIDIELDSVDNAVVVPIESVETDNTGSYIYLFNEKKSTVTRVPVELGLSTDTQYQVVSGCTAGDKIVQNPATALKAIAEEGEKVAAVYENDAAV